MSRFGRLPKGLAKKLGIPGPKVKGIKKPTFEITDNAFQLYDIPAPTAREFRFSCERKWRFDFYWNGRRSGSYPGVVLEVQGGLFSKGAHVNGASLRKEYEKLNEAAILGYRVLFCTPDDVKSGAIFPILRRALGR